MNKDTLREVAEQFPGYVMQPYGAMIWMDGLDAVVHFSQYIGGDTIYVPSVKTIFKEPLELALIKEFTGYNHRELSCKYGFSRRHIERITQETKE